MAFGFLKKAVKGVGKGLGKVVSNPMIKMGAAGFAVAFPPAGIPTALAIETTDRVLKATKSPNPTVKKAATRLVVNTAALAKGGDPDARRGLKVLQERKRQLTGKSPAASSGRRRFANAFVVTREGRIAYRGNVETA